MATIKKISALPAATAATTADLMPIVQGGVTKQLSFGSLMGSPTLFGSGVATFLATPSSANLNAALTTKTGTGLAVFGTSPTLASPTVTAPTVSGGNLTFSGTAQRITGDFSNATVGNRLLFQTSTANAATVVGAIPNGTGTITQFAAYGGSDPANAQVLRLDTRGGSESRIETTFAGTPASGTYLPMTFYTGGSERVRIDTSGNVGIGLTPNSGQGTLQSFRSVAGGAPVTSGSSDANQAAMFAAGSVQLSYGATAAGSGWLQMRSSANFAVNYDLLLNPNGGNVLIGADTASGTGRLQVFAPDAGATIRVMRFSNDASPAQLLLRKNRGTASTSFTAVQNGDNCGSIVGQGADGSAYGNLGSIAFNADGNASSGSTPGLISFATTPSGANTPTERMRISASGNVIQGTAAVATTATDGFLWITSCAGAPTGAPTAPYTNAAALVCDTTNNRLYVRVGTTWRYATLI